ncbi:PLC-like phosphodiesterase [Russula earlei]|uniref:PLC-like phosphodiesterase n=1 Tax=Russula earlei TaxID=71964 RepID=A0ACC0UNL5_9AGAM|nr:PLC-like phosphodiesterase [Russula earlei]
MLECWGHRGASAAFPENTLASFESAIRDGAEGIESDVHVSRDGVVVMFHDPSLERTTDSKGLIREREWYGPKGMMHVRTIKEPKQPIPTFKETLDLLMKPENQHVKFNIDVKVYNEPEQIFSLMDRIISSYPEWETRLAPRIILGLWHPRFLSAAKVHLPYCQRSHIGASPDIARRYFWDACDAFSMWFPSLATADGERPGLSDFGGDDFLTACKRAGKKLMVWTVNNPAEMMEAVRWGVDAILTDVTSTWLDLRAALDGDYDKVGAQYTRLFLWTGPLYYAAVQYGFLLLGKRQLERVAGSFDIAESEANMQAAVVRVRA